MQYTENYQYRKPVIGVDVADIKDMNFNSDRTDTLIHNTQISLAPAYDLNETYDTGNVVMYETLMYKCKEDGVTGAWDASKWERTTAGEEGSGGGGGSSVVPNPSGTPTDTLETIEIDGTVFDIAGSGGGGSGGILDEVIFTDTAGTVGTRNITLTKSLNNFDAIYFEWFGTTEEQYTASHASPVYPIEANDNGNVSIVCYPTYGNRYILLNGNPTSTSVSLESGTWDTVPLSVYKIHGLKFSGGGTGGGLERTLLWDYVTDNNNTIPYGLYTETLHDDIDNYDFIVAEIVSASGDLSASGWEGTNLWTIDVNALNNTEVQNYLNYTSFGERSSRFYIKDTTFQKTTNNQANTNGLVRVYGLKWASGGSGGGLERTLLYTTGSYTTACPYQQDVPLLDNLSKYDFISVETGTIMDNSSGGAKIDVAWYDVSEILQPNVLTHWAGYSTRWWQAVFTDTTFNMTGRGSESGSYNHEIFRIFGYKIGAGSSGSGMSSEVIPISAGDGTTSRTFTFSKTPKKITMQGYTSGDGGWYESGYFIWGENFMNLIGAQGTIATGGYAGQAAISYGADGKSFTITASNAFGAFNRADSFSGMMLVDYGGGSEGSSEEISDMTWTLLDSTTSTGTATPIPSGTKYIVVLSKDGNNGKVTMVAKESLSNINKVMDLLQETTYILGGYWKGQAGADYGDTSCQISNGQVIAYSSYITNTTYVYAVS